MHPDEFYRIVAREAVQEWADDRVFASGALAIERLGERVGVAIQVPGKGQIERSDYIFDASIKDKRDWENEVRRVLENATKEALETSMERAWRYGQLMGRYHFWERLRFLFSGI